MEDACATRLNPRVGHTYGDEDNVGIVSRWAKAVSNAGPLALSRPLVEKDLLYFSSNLCAPM